MTTAWYPFTKGTEVAQKYIEVMQEIPQESFEKRLVTAVRSDKDGIVYIDIVEPTKGKFEEAFNLAVRRETMYRDIEGFRFELDTLLTVEEAMPLLGLAAP